MDIYTKTNPYKPDFLAFDKYERDDFDGVPNSYNNGYLYNIPAWNNYIRFVGAVSQALDNIPIMLFQYQGGHLQIKNDLDVRHLHGATGATYFFGDSNLMPDLINLDDYISKLSFAHPFEDYHFSGTLMDYLQVYDSNQDTWKNDHVDEFKKANIFAILWGGGNTTSIAGLSEATDDAQDERGYSSWLLMHIIDCYKQKKCYHTAL